MAFGFRIRFVLPDGQRIDSGDEQLRIPDPIEGKTIFLKAGAGASKLADADHIALFGESFPTQQDALNAGERWSQVLQGAFIRISLAANFGTRERKQGLVLTRHGRKWLESEFGGPVLTDVHGLSVFECPPRPKFVSGSVNASVGKNPDQLRTAIEAAIRLPRVLSPTEQLAYDLYAASFFESSADAQFAMLMMAVETMIDPAPRADDVRAHIDGLVTDVKTSSLPSTEINSIVGQLNYARRESISQAGRKLASRLAGNSYMEQDPEKFFGDCYNLRSELFHGYAPRPDVERVQERISPLREFVADLLT